jgi:hypothetical protein
LEGSVGHLERNSSSNEVDTSKRPCGCVGVDDTFACFAALPWVVFDTSNTFAARSAMRSRASAKIFGPGLLAACPGVARGRDICRCQCANAKQTLPRLGKQYSNESPFRPFWLHTRDIVKCCERERARILVEITAPSTKRAPVTPFLCTAQ